MGLLVGLLIGLVLGLTGAGGSVFAVPLLILLLDLPMADAVGLALGAVAVSALYGSIRNGSQRLVLWWPALFLAIGGVLFAPLGKWLGNQLPELWLLVGFNALALVIAARMWLGARRNPSNARILRANAGFGSEAPTNLCRLSPKGQFELRLPCISGLLVGGISVGLLSGLFGVGGGFLIVPLLLALSQVAMPQAVATSLVIITLVSGSGLVSHLWLSPSSVDLTLLAWLSAGGIAGMVMGQLIGHKIDGARLQQVFAFSLIAVSLGSLFTLFS